MLKKNIFLILHLALALGILVNLPFPALAEAKLMRLSAYQDKSADFTIHQTYGEKGDFKPVIRTNGDLEIKWRYDVENPSLNMVIDSEGTVYFADDNKVLYAIDVNGNRKWMTPLKISGLVSLVMGADETIYVIHNGGLLENESPGSIHAVSSDGKEKWSARIDKPLDFVWEDHFSGDAKDNLTVLTENGIVSYNNRGVVRWTNKDILKVKKLDSFKVPNIFTVRTDISGNIYLQTKDTLYSLDPEGKLRWQTQVSIGWGNIHINPDGYLYAFNQFGLNVADSQTGRVITGQEISKRGMTGFTVKESWAGGAYFQNEWNQYGIESMDNNKKVKWRYNPAIGSNGTPGDIAADREGNVYFADLSGNIFSLDKDGNERFILTRRNRYHTSTDLLVNKQGDLLCLSEELGLVCLGKPKIEVFVGNEHLPLEVPPLIEKGNTMVPFRTVFEKLGLDISWDPTSQTVTGSNDNLRLRLQAGNKSVELNGETKTLAAEPKIIKGCLFVPLRFIGEALGLEVVWDSKAKKVYIGTAEQQVLLAVNRYINCLDRRDVAGTTAMIHEENPAYNNATAYYEKLFFTKCIKQELKSCTVIEQNGSEASVRVAEMESELDWGLARQEATESLIKLRKSRDGSWKIYEVSKAQVCQQAESRF